MQMTVSPTHRCLKYLVELRECDAAWNQQTTPDQWLDFEHLKLEFVYLNSPKFVGNHHYLPLLVFTVAVGLLLHQKHFDTHSLPAQLHFAFVTPDISCGASGIVVAIVIHARPEKALAAVASPTVDVESRNGNDHMKTCLTSLLAGVLFVASISMPAAAQQTNAEPILMDKVKAKIAKIGVGEKAKATVFLKDGTKIKGYIGQAGSDDFVLRDRKTDAPTTIRYSEVAKVDNNRGHSTARNLGLGIGIGAGAFLAILLIAIAHLD
jgi:hypothetical protein